MNCYIVTMLTLVVSFVLLSNLILKCVLKLYVEHCGDVLGDTGDEILETGDEALLLIQRITALKIHA